MRGDPFGMMRTGGALLLLAAPPLLCLCTLGTPNEISFSLPPQAFPHPAQPANWIAVGGLSALLLVLGALTTRWLCSCCGKFPKKRKGSVWRLLLAGLPLVGFWVLAWNRFGWMGAFQFHTFTALWLSFLIFANVWVVELGGAAPLFRNSKNYFLLFPTSAVMWWSFELLNRFSQNWQYTNLQDFSATTYVLFASLSFATVLPAISVVYSLLDRILSEPRNTQSSFTLRLKSEEVYALSGASLVVLFLLPRYPDQLYPIVWIAPVLLYFAISRLFKTPCMLDELAFGRYSTVVKYSLSGILCGFLWELWNLYSLTQWTYRISYVGIVHLFEMPLLGYLGYVPFGIFCGLVIESIRSPSPTPAAVPTDLEDHFPLLL